jgi:hypothetical protein
MRARISVRLPRLSGYMGLACMSELTRRLPDVHLSRATCGDTTQHRALPWSDTWSSNWVEQWTPRPDTDYVSCVS